MTLGTLRSELRVEIVLEFVWFERMKMMITYDRFEFYQPF